MDTPLRLFKTPEGQAKYMSAYDATLKMWGVPTESSFINTPYGQTHVIRCGQSGTPTLVLLHAGQASSTMWFPNIALLSKQYQIFAVDTLGEPGKSIPTRPYASRSDAAIWVRSVLDELEIAKTHIMGLSRGAWLSLNLAIFAPERLRKVVLLSPAASFVSLNRFFTAVAGMVMRIPARFVAQFAILNEPRRCCGSFSIKQDIEKGTI